MIKFIYNNLLSFVTGKGTIFMLHRVDNYNSNGIKAIEDLKITPQYLENIIIQLKELNYEFISIYDIDKYLNKSKKFVIFTLDDGYKDNYTNAYPIFKKYNIPFTLYITSTFLSKQPFIWWEVLADLILENKTIHLSNTEILHCNTKDEKNITFQLISKKIFQFNQTTLKEEFIKLLNNYKFDFNKYSRLCMRWEDLEELSQDSLVTIGAHTVNHLYLNKLSKDEIIYEVIENKLEIEKKLNIKVKTFAYPYGNRSSVTKREIEIVKNLGFDSCVTTYTGNIFSKHINCKYALPRVGLTNNFSLKTKLFLIPLIKNKFKQFVCEE